MRHRVTIQSFTSVRDATGQPIPTWSDWLVDQPARVVDSSGGTSYRGQQLQETVDAIFEMRFRDNVLPNQRLVHDGKTYNITRVSPADGGRRYMAIFATVVVV